MTASGPGPQELVERALAQSKADDCIAIAHVETSANLRWANNTLTTNGEMCGQQLTVISFAGKGAASVSGSATTLEQVRSLVETADTAARSADPAEDRAQLIGGEESADWSEAPGETDITVYSEFAPALGDTFARAAAARRVLYGFVNHQVVTTYLGSSTGLRLRHVQPTGHWACTGKDSEHTRQRQNAIICKDHNDTTASMLKTE